MKDGDHQQNDGELHPAWSTCRQMPAPVDPKKPCPRSQSGSGEADKSCAFSMPTVTGENAKGIGVFFSERKL